MDVGWYHSKVTAKGLLLIIFNFREAMIKLQRLTSQQCNGAMGEIWDSILNRWKYTTLITTLLYKSLILLPSELDHYKVNWLAVKLLYFTTRPNMTLRLLCLYSDKFLIEILFLVIYLVTIQPKTNFNLNFVSLIKS